MKRYCRYCIYCHVGNGNWCEARQKEYPDSYFRRLNHCEEFEFCEIDVYDSNRTYKPRDRQNRRGRLEEAEQLSMF